MFEAPQLIAPDADIHPWGLAIAPPDNPDPEVWVDHDFLQADLEMGNGQDSNGDTYEAVVTLTIAGELCGVPSP